MLPSARPGTDPRSDRHRHKPFTDNYQLFLKGEKTADQALADIANAWETTVFQDRLAQ